MQQQKQYEMGSGRSVSTRKSSSDVGTSQHVGTDNSLAQHALCLVNGAKQSAVELAQHLRLESSLPFKLLAASWLLTNVLLPLLLISHPLARSTLIHAFAAVSGSLLLYHLLGDGPFLFASFLSLLPLMVPRMPSQFVEVEGRTVLLLPPLFFPRLLPLWRQSQLVVDTVAVCAVVEQLRQHVKVGRQRGDGKKETSVKVDMPAVGREVRSGGWELAVKLQFQSRAAPKREDEMETDSQAEEETEGQQQQHTKQTEQKRYEEWSREEKREREEAEYPRAPTVLTSRLPAQDEADRQAGGGSREACRGSCERGGRA